MESNIHQPRGTRATVGSGQDSPNEAAHRLRRPYLRRIPSRDGSLTVRFIPKKVYAERMTCIR